MKLLPTLSLLLLVNLAFAQANTKIKWFNPIHGETQVIEGQAWPNEVEEPYDRLPARAEATVAQPVWNLSSQSAGLMIRFRSNAEEINIRYGTKWNRVATAPPENYGMNHMPATGVSGVDLYAIDSDGKELWCASRRNFADTIRYRFAGLNPNDRYHDKGREYRLYLPLYNQVTWMEIGVEKDTYFEALPVRPEKPIVVYGTSIAQGACASRPGMAWTSILSRKMDRPLINLGFSGNGKLEQPVIELLGEIDAKIYILDCMPNLSTPGWERSSIKNAEDLKNRILEAVRKLKALQPDIPILIVEHGGYTEEFISNSRKQHYSIPNQIQQSAFYQLKQEGYQGLYYLSKEEIGLSLDAMVDGVHPTDFGMMQYAQSYTKTLRTILQEPTGSASTTHPITQYREPGNYDWEKRHHEILQLNNTAPPKTVMLANSIIHFWGGQPQTKIAREEASWKDLLTPMGVANYAYSWDRIENVLWRVYHGELDGFDAERIMVMIGTNNLHLNTNEEMIEGLHLLIQAIKNRQPKAEIVLMGLLPSRDYEQRIQYLNMNIARLSSTLSVKFADLGAPFLTEQNQVKESLFSDGLHPNKAGYIQLREILVPLLKEK